MSNNNKFKPAWWLSNPHLQTTWSVFARRRIEIALRRECLELPDGDFVHLDWTVAGTGPIVLVLHGLAGSIESHYAKGILQAINHCGWRGVFMHFRGCSGTPNRLPRSYHSGETGDVQYVVEQIRQREPNTPIAAVGYSLGGNVLIKWLGETGDKNPLTAAVVISVPFELAKIADQMDRGFSRVYQWWLMRSLHEAVEQKLKTIQTILAVEDVRKLNNFWQFDEKITAPLHGFTNANDYYKKSSSRQYLHNICVPTLILHGRDDPFMTSDVIPQNDELPPGVHMEVSEKGGHLGFIAGNVPFKPIYWSEQRVVDYLRGFLEK